MIQPWQALDGRRLGLALAGLGWLATASQVHLVREFLAQFAGNELSLAVIFACWFTGIVIGATVGGRLAAEPLRAWRRLLAVGLLLPPALFAQVCLIRLWRLVTTIPVGQLPSVGQLLIAGLVIITPLSLLIGMAFPLACRVAAGAHEDPLGVGRAYVLESAGAILGGVAVGILLPGWLPPLASLAVACLLWTVGLGCAAWPHQRWAIAACFGLTAVLVVATATGLTTRLDGASTLWRFRSLATGGQRIAWDDTAYQHLDLAERAGQHNLYADCKLTASYPDPYSARPRAHLVLTQHAAPQRVLLLGPGFAGFVQTALTHPIARLDQVSLDPGVDALVAPTLSPAARQTLAAERVRRHITDGRRFLQSGRSRWDLIFADTADPDTANRNRFYTREFYELVRDHLRPGGVFAGRVSSAVGLLSPEAAERMRSLQLTLQAVFDHVVLIPGQETLLFASDQPDQLLTRADQLAERYRLRDVRDPHFSHHRFGLLVQHNLVIDLAQQLADRGRTPINTDERPVTYLHSVLAWSRMTGDPAGQLIEALLQVPPAAWFGLLPLLALPLVLAALLRRRQPARAVRRAATLAIGTIGAVGMALELVLSFAYQSLAGSLYQELGLIVAAFMTGLVLAGSWVQRRLRRAAAGPAGLGWVLLALAAFCALMPWLQSAGWLQALPMWLGQSWLLLLVLASGAATGATFPLAGQIAVRAGEPLGRAAGALDAWDHLGAALGALLAGMLLVPTLGRGWTCLLLAELCTLAALLNLVVSRMVPTGRERADAGGRA